MENNDDLSSSFYIGLAGCFALIIGVFAPLMSAPFIGTINYFQGGEGDGVIILVIAGFSLILVFVKQYKALYLTALLSLGMTVFTYLNIQREFGSISEELGGYGDLARGMIEFS